VIHIPSWVCQYVSLTYQMDVFLNSCFRIYHVAVNLEGKVIIFTIPVRRQVENNGTQVNPFVVCRFRFDFPGIGRGQGNNSIV
jgi:hypothetical protein